MQEPISCCAGQSGFSYSFDNGKIINYQDNFNKIGDLPFSIYYDFETTTGSTVFFDAKMYVVSYCIVVAFHPDLNLPHLFIYRAYDQTTEELESRVHFCTIQKDFFNFTEHFNLKTLKQLQDAVLSVCNRSRETALAEMFNIELKFTVDCLRKWTDKNKVLELDEKQKNDYMQNNKRGTCYICDFPMESRAPNGWFENVCRGEHLFLENLYKTKEMFQMEILNFEIFMDKVANILDKVDEFCESIEREHLGNIIAGKDWDEINAIVDKIKKTKTYKNDADDELT